MTSFWREELESLGLGSVAEAMLESNRDTTTSPTSHADAAAEAADLLLAEYRERVSSAAELAVLYSMATDVISRAAGEDAQIARRGENARYWRECLPDVAEELFGG